MYLSQQNHGQLCDEIFGIKQWFGFDRRDYSVRVPTSLLFLLGKVAVGVGQETVPAGRHNIYDDNNEHGVKECHCRTDDIDNSITTAVNTGGSSRRAYHYTGCIYPSSTRTRVEADNNNQTSTSNTRHGNINMIIINKLN